MKIIETGQTVERIQPGDYTNGRIGDVLQVNNGRAKVLWHSKRSGLDVIPDKNPKTWVSIDRLDLYSNDKPSLLRYLSAQKAFFTSRSKNIRMFSANYRKEMEERVVEYQAKIDSLK